MKINKPSVTLLIERCLRLQLLAASLGLISRVYSKSQLKVLDVSELSMYRDSLRLELTTLSLNNLRRNSDKELKGLMSKLLAQEWESLPFSFNPSKNSGGDKT